MTFANSPTSRHSWLLDMAETLTATQLLAAAREVLTGSGYIEAHLEAGDSGTRVFEDAFGIVAIHVFDTWGQLKDRWHLAQGLLVDLISEHVRRAEAKAWEGYLVLLTPGLLPSAEMSTINDLRGDTNRVRKLVATGEDLATLNDVRSALLPLLPLVIDDPSSTQTSLLELLPELLAENSIPLSVTGVVVDAFTANESILERLHSSRADQ
jgi:hypothetical protein